MPKKYSKKIAVKHKTAWNYRFDLPKKRSKKRKWSCWKKEEKPLQIKKNEIRQRAKKKMKH